ncbi:hypothetical protein CMI37_28185 [Candidatus Pacearchaeota archaeon]|nr:hypothetical protein [Candidatus Pacearchaeota archaeon]
MEDNKTVDTPQQANQNDATSAFEAPTAPTVTEGSANTNLTVEDAFFGNATDTQQEDAPPSQEQVPQAQEITETPTEYQAKNDEKRFEYWQSQAAQRANELKELKQQVEQTNQPQSQAQVPEQAPQVEEFPPPPGKPQKPHGYSREDAWGDPASESARYLDEVDTWQEDISEYNELKHQYDMATMQEKFEGIEREKVETAQRHEAQAQQQRQIQDVSQYVQGHHGFSEADTQDFIQTMSQPDSISMDNLVALYRMQKGGAQAPVNAEPSPSFQQAQNAQQIPSPMGVMPASGNSERSDSDQIMDSLIGDFNSNNPWK